MQNRYIYKKEFAITYDRSASSEEEALNLLFEGETNRAIAEHQLNSSSSRYCIVSIIAVIPNIILTIVQISLYFHYSL